MLEIGIESFGNQISKYTPNTTAQEDKSQLLHALKV